MLQARLPGAPAITQDNRPPHFTNTPVTIPTANVKTLYQIGALGNTTRAFASVNFTVTT